MNNLKYIIIAAMGLLLAISSCSGDDVERIRTLEVEESSVIIQKEAQTKTVGVTVDKGALYTVSWDGDSWGSAVPDLKAGVIEIIATANTTKTLRRAAIILTLEGGFRNKVIQVTQNGESPLLSVFPDEISFDFMANEFIADVESDVEWSANSDVEWLNVERFIKAGSIVVTALENKSYNARSTGVTVTAGDSSKEIVVIQDAALSFLLPYLSIQEGSYENILAFEQVRHSTVVASRNRAAPHNAYTRSLFMPVVSYMVFGTEMNFASIENLNEKNLPGFFRKGTEMGKAHDFMLENNIEYLFSASEKDYYWMDLGVGSTKHYQVIVDNSLKFVSYEALASPHDPPNAPTFDVFPSIPAEITWGSHKDVVKGWERLNGGIISANEDKEIAFDVPDDDSYRMRIYTYKEVDTNLISVFYLFNESEVSKLFVVVAGGYMLNPRLDVLLDAEGYKYAGSDGGFPIYGNAAKEVLCKIYMATLADGPAVYGVFEYRYNPATGEAPFKAQIQTSHYKTLEGVNIIRK